MPAEQAGQGDVVAEGERRQQVEELEDEADALAPQAGQRVVVEAAEVAALDARAARPTGGPWRRTGAAAWTCRSPTGPSAPRSRRASSVERHPAQGRDRARRRRCRSSRGRRRRAAASSQCMTHAGRPGSVPAAPSGLARRRARLRFTMNVRPGPSDSRRMRGRPACSSVAQRQSIRLLTGGLLVRIQPEEPISLTNLIDSSSDRPIVT